MVAVALDPDTVAAVKLALVCPAATVTLAGTVAAALLRDNVTTVPPLGAAAVRVTVPVALAPPVTALGFSVRTEGTGAGGVGVGFDITEYV